MFDYTRTYACVFMCLFLFAILFFCLSTLFIYLFPSFQTSNLSIFYDHFSMKGVVLVIISEIFNTQYDMDACECPLPCHVTKYNTKVTSAYFPFNNWWTIRHGFTCYKMPNLKETRLNHIFHSINFQPVNENNNNNNNNNNNTNNKTTRNFSAHSWNSNVFNTLCEIICMTSKYPLIHVSYLLHRPISSYIHCHYSYCFESHYVYSHWGFTSCVNSYCALSNFHNSHRVYNHFIYSYFGYCEFQERLARRMAASENFL